MGLGGAFIIGFVAVSLWGEPTDTASTLLMAALAILLGALEGAIVGLTQGWVLKRRLSTIAVGRWVLATAIGAFLAWTLGMLPSTIMSLSPDNSTAPPPEIPDYVNYLMAIGLGAVAGPILAFAQWLALRRLAARAWLWIPVNAAAWMVGMPIIFVGPGIIQEDTPVLTIGLIILVIVALDGAAVGAIHGYALIRFLLPAPLMKQQVNQ